jgi:hypothetical protein
MLYFHEVDIDAHEFQDLFTEWGMKSTVAVITHSKDKTLMQKVKYKLKLYEADIFDDEFVTAYSDLIISILMNDDSKENYYIGDTYCELNRLYKKHGYPERYISYSTDDFRLERVC